MTRPPRPRGAPARSPRRSRRARTGTGDRGSAAIEFLGFLPILLLVALAGVQLGLLAYAGTEAGTAARTAARTGNPTDGGASVSGWLHPDVQVGQDGDETTATVTIQVPSVLPGFSLLGPVVRRATMPWDGTPR